MSISLRLSQCMINAINTIAMADMNDSFHGFFPLVLLSEVNINFSITQMQSKIITNSKFISIISGTSFQKQVTGIAAVVLMGIWMIHYRKGFAWQDDPSHEFNWHPFLMTIGLVFLYGNGIKHSYKYYHTRILSNPVLNIVLII